MTTTTNDAALAWRTASFTANLDCVEVAWRPGAAGPTPLVRDSKSRATGVLALGEGAWRGLLARARAA